MQYGQYPPPRFTVAHLSDVHLLAHGEKQYGAVVPESGLVDALERLSRLDPVPQALVFTGDLADKASPRPTPGCARSSSRPRRRWAPRSCG